MKFMIRLTYKLIRLIQPKLIQNEEQDGDDEHRDRLQLTKEE